MDLVFLTSKQVNNQLEQGYLVMMPLSQIDLLANKQQVLAASESKAAR